MKKEKTITIDVENLIALCHMLDSFDKFNESAIILFSVKDKCNLLDKLVKVSRNKFCLNSGKVKRFYNENKTVINTIKKYSQVWNFFWKNYCQSVKDNYNFNYMYQYILDNKEKLDKIIVVLEKIKKLGFMNLEFNKNLDFTEEVYELGVSMSLNDYFTYLDNLEVLPSYKASEVKYKTTGSNYRIIFSRPDSLIRGYNDEIKLNSLTFDADRLPNSLSKKDTFDKIMALQDKREQDCIIVRNLVNLSVGLEDLSCMLNSLDEAIEKIDSTQSKEQLKQLLTNIRQSAIQMQGINDEYEKKTIENSEYITEDVLEKAKELYKRRRYEAINHWD